MQLRCPHCQTIFALNRETVQIAYEQVVKENLHHYDAHCPKCRRAVYVTRQQFERFNPWLKNPPQDRSTTTQAPRPAAVVAAPAANQPAKVQAAPVAGKPASKVAAATSAKKAKPVKKNSSKKK